MLGWCYNLDLKNNYSNRDGSRLTITEYKKRRKKEIILHLSIVGIAIILIIASIVSITIKLRSKKNTDTQAEVTENDAPEINIVETDIMEPESEPEIEEEVNPFLEASEDAASFFSGYDIICAQ